MLRAGLYARISTNDQQTLTMQRRTMRKYAIRRVLALRLHALLGSIRDKGVLPMKSSISIRLE
jgi:DNA invertase Pin-like site-specific DNA recombinase